MIGYRDRGPHPDCVGCRGTGMIGIPGIKCKMCASAHLADDFKRIVETEEAQMPQYIPESDNDSSSQGN